MKLQVSLQFVAFNHSGVYSYCLQVFELTDQCRNQFSKPKSKLKVLNASSQPLPLQPEHKELNKTALNKSSSPIEDETMGLLLLAGVSLNGQRELSPPAPQPSTCTAAWRGGRNSDGLASDFMQTKRGFEHTKSTGHSSFNLCSKAGQKVKLVLRNMEIIEKHVVSGPTYADFILHYSKTQMLLQCKNISLMLELSGGRRFSGQC